MPSEFSSNIRQIARELKETDRKTATAVRRAIRLAVAEAAKETTDAIRDAADAEGLVQAKAATRVKVSFGVRGGGGVIATDAAKAPYARPLEKGSQGSGGAYDRHPVFGSTTFGPLKQGQRRATVWVNQPTRPFFYSTAKQMEPFNEDAFSAAMDTALAEAGWTGAVRRRAQRGAVRTAAVKRKAAATRRLNKRLAQRAEERKQIFKRAFRG